MKDVISASTGKHYVAFAPRSGVAMSVGQNVSKKGSGRATTLEAEETNNYPSAIYWGNNNRRPDDILSKISKYGVGCAGLKFNQDLHYGRGPMVYRQQKDESGKHISVFPILSGDEDGGSWVDSLDDLCWKRHLKDQIQNLEYFGACWVEMVLSNDRNSIAEVKVHKAKHGRYQHPNPATNRIENVLLSGKWAVGAGKEYIYPVPLVSPYARPDQIKEIARKKRWKSFIFPCVVPHLFNYYPELPWHAVIDNGWLDVALSVPSFKNALFANQMHIKYHILVPDEYFEQKYSESWAGLEDVEKDEKRGEFLSEVNDWLVGKDNAGKAILSYYSMGADGKPLPTIQIEVLDDKMKDGSLIPDSQAADIQILGSMLVDPSLMGFGFPGASMGAGSGSDKMQAFNIKSSQKTTDRETTMEPWLFVLRFNGAPRWLRLGFTDHTLTTLNENPTGREETASA